MIENNSDSILLIQNGHALPAETTKPLFVQNHSFEILDNLIPFLNNCYYDAEGNQLEVEVRNISKYYYQHLSKAFDLIYENTPDFYKLLKVVLKKIVIFNVDTNLRNSFADKSAHGVIFLNAYQEDYDEVFFVDDIAHQSGHVIMNTLLFDPNEYFIVPINHTMEEIEIGNNDVEKRDLHIVYHALYTYYTVFLCLDACLDAKVFNARQVHEALGRLKFYIGKCNHDLNLFKENHRDKLIFKELLTEKGWELIFSIQEKHQEIFKKWKEALIHFKLDNQPYNFTYSKFAEINPLHE